MGEKTAVRTREKWVDDVKVIACILVTGPFLPKHDKGEYSARK